jgi:hypothetical protein
LQGFCGCRLACFTRLQKFGCRRFTLGGTGSYMGKRYFDIGEHNQEGSYTRLDLQASWTSPEGRYKVLGLMTNATDEEAYNTYGCNANVGSVYGTDSFIPRCGGNPIDQRLWEVEFMLKI